MARRGERGVKRGVFGDELLVMSDGKVVTVLGLVMRDADILQALPFKGSTRTE